MSDHRSSPRSLFPGKFSLKGFTILELMVVVTILGILVALLISAFNRFQNISETEVCKSNMRETWQAFMAYSADNEGRIYDAAYGRNILRGGGSYNQTIPASMRNNPNWNSHWEIGRVSNGMANTVSVRSTWGNLLVPEYLDLQPGLGPLPQGGNMTARIPYCPGYVGDSVVAYRYYGHAIPRGMLLYGKYIHRIPGSRAENVIMPDLSRFVFLLDGQYPVYTTRTTLRGVYNFGQGGGYRTIERRIHGANRDRLNFLMADGSAHSLPALNPSSQDGGFPLHLAYVPGHFNSRPESYGFMVNNRFSEVYMSIPDASGYEPTD